MTTKTRRPASLFTETADDLPLFSGTCQRTEASNYTPQEQPQQASLLDRREYIAKSAFYGCNDKLMARVMDKNGYEINGHHYPANSISLAEFIDTVQSMSDSELSALTPESNTEARQQQADD